MSKSHYWLGTERENRLILDWLRDNGALPVGIGWEKITFDQRRDTILHFPAIGPIEFWPDKIDISGFPGSTPRWKSAALASIAQQERPNVRQIDADHSAVALLRAPFKMEGLIWTTGELHFTGMNLAKSFPPLNSICNKFGRWLAKNELVYSWRGKETFNPFGYNLGGVEGWAKKVFAMPEAYQLLRDGSVMVDRMISTKKFAEFIRALELRGMDMKALQGK